MEEHTPTGGMDEHTPTSRMEEHTPTSGMEEHTPAGRMEEHSVCTNEVCVRSDFVPQEQKHLLANEGHLLADEGKFIETKKTCQRNHQSACRSDQCAGA